jgi:hypothetical protein
LPLPLTETASEAAATKTAVTDVLELTVTVHVPVPVHAPCQPVNSAPEPAVAVSVTLVPGGYPSLQSPGQSIPGPDTLPLPLPPRETVNDALATKTAVTDLLESIVTMQVPVPVQSPCQPVKTAPGLAAGVKVTPAPKGYDALQVPGQLIEVPVTVPGPVTWTVSVGGPANPAETVLSPSIVTTHVGAVPLHAPPHPLNLAPAPGDANNVTVDPVIVSVQLGGQVSSVLVDTVPGPLTCMVNTGLLGK